MKKTPFNNYPKQRTAKLFVKTFNEEVPCTSIIRAQALYYQLKAQGIGALIVHKFKDGTEKSISPIGEFGSEVAM